MQATYCLQIILIIILPNSQADPVPALLHTLKNVLLPFDLQKMIL